MDALYKTSRSAATDGRHHPVGVATHAALIRIYWNRASRPFTFPYP